MTPHEAFIEGRLAEAIDLQEIAVSAGAARPDDRLFLTELLIFAGRLDEARSQLALIQSDDPSWPPTARNIRRLLRAETRRSFQPRKPVFLPGPTPRHAKCRWVAVKALLRGEPRSAVRWVDHADANTPELRGFIDGREFEEIRDADDRFASILEAVIEGRYSWLPWEAVQRVKLGPVQYALDRLYRPAEIRFHDGTACSADLPLIYPGSSDGDGAFAVGLETDRVCPDDGPIRCVGAKLLLAGDEEVPLSECSMIEIRR